jgi:hypothetical protein
MKDWKRIYKDENGEIIEEAKYENWQKI